MEDLRKDDKCAVPQWCRYDLRFFFFPQRIYQVSNLKYLIPTQKKTRICSWCKCAVFGDSVYCIEG